MTRRPHLVAVDAMGGDAAPHAIVAGAVDAHAAGLGVVLVGDANVIGRWVPDDGPAVVHAPDLVRMDADPAAARAAHDSAIRVVMRCVADGRADAALSCGNSGATMVAAVLELGKIDGIDRPGLATTLPRPRMGPLVVTDIGASPDATADHLVDFARLGHAYARTLGIAVPRVGLLSNGSEPGKGNRLVAEAHPRLAALPLDYVGHVEAHDALAGAVDVLVTDGFTGNVLLKTAEGVVGMLGQSLAAGIRGSWRTRVGAGWLRPWLQGLRRELDWRDRGGALLLGVPAPVVVGHGRADAQAVRAAVGLAHYAIGGGIVGSVTRAAAEPLVGPVVQVSDARSDDRPPSTETP